MIERFTLSANGNRKRKRVAVMFGGRSVEHEISIITGLQLIKAIDVVQYEPLAVYIAPSGRWYAGDALLDKNFYKNMPASLATADEVTLLPFPGTGGLTVLKSRSGSRLNVINSVEENVLPVDLYLVAFHGTFGEDGCIQGLLELADAAYAGCGVLPAALGMSKYHCKKILESHGIPVLPGELVLRESIETSMGKDLVKIRQHLIKAEGLERFPLFVKPCNLGSSIGVARVNDENELDAALIQAFRYDSAAIVEPCLDQKMEINVSVMDDLEPFASVVEIPVSSSGEELTYEDKYMRGGGKKGGGQGMAALTRVIDPEDLDEKIKNQARDLAVRSFKALGCSGVARIDFMMDLKGNRLYFNEINTLPGSLSFYLWMNSKPPIFFTELLTRMLERAEARTNRKKALSRAIGFKALFK